MIIFLLLGIFIVSGIWELYYRRNWSENLTVKLWFENDRVYAGNQTKLYEVIENRKRMPIPVLEVGFHTKKALDFADIENTNVSDYIYKRDVFSVLGKQKITREIPVKCEKRGRYEVSDADIKTYSLLYRSHYSQSIETSAGIYVYPKNTDVSHIMTVCERMIGTLQCSKKLYEDPFSFRTIRNYTIDDPMKTINWKASAKTGSLMVNTFDSVQSQKAFVFLDVEDGGILKYEDLVEESISIAATIIRKLSRQSTEVGFAYNGDSDLGNILAPTIKKSAIADVEKLLAEYDYKNSFENKIEKLSIFVKELFDTQFSKAPIDEDTLLIFISKNLNNELMECISGCIGERQALIVVPVYRNEKAAASDSPDNIHVVVKEVERT
jgi:uncharacterized protein (DUF58 family)